MEHVYWPASLVIPSDMHAYTHHFSKLLLSFKGAEHWQEVGLFR